MKYLVSISFILVIITCCHNGNWHINNEVDKISFTNINLNKFKGHKLDSLLKDRYFRNYTSFYFMDEPPGILNGLSLCYPDSTCIDIILRKLVYTKPFNENMKWNLDTVSRETIF